MSQVASVRKTSAWLADGRELIYFGSFADSPDPCTDTRDLQPVSVSSEARYDLLLDEWVLITGHRMGRTFLPPDSECPLCPSKPSSTRRHPRMSPPSTSGSASLHGRVREALRIRAGTRCGSAP